MPWPRPVRLFRSRFHHRVSRLNVVSQGRAVACLVALAAPAVIAALYIRAYAVNVPGAEEWLTWGLMRTLADHQVAPLLQALTTPFQNHFIATAIPLLLAMGFLTRWNVVAESYLSWIFLVLNLVALVALLKASMRRRFDTGTILLSVPLAFIVFTLAQRDGLLFGMQMLTSIANGLALLALYFSTTQGRSRFSAIPLALAAAFSFANGLFIWPAGFIALVVYAKENGAWRRVWAWTLAGVAVFTAFIVAGGTRTGWWTEQRPSVSDVILFGVYVFGSPLAGEKESALPLGMIALITSAVIAIVCAIRFFRGDARTSIPLAVIAFGFMIVAAASAGRSNLGPGAALQTRYISGALIVFAGCWLAICSTRSPALIAGGAVASAALYCAGLGMGLPAGPGWLVSRSMEGYIMRNYRWQSDYYVSLIFGGGDAGAQRALLAEVERARLSVFADLPPSVATLTMLAEPAPVANVTVNLLPILPGGSVAVTPINGSVIVSGTLTDDAEDVVMQVEGTYEPQCFRHDNHLFDCFISTSLTSDGAHEFRLQVVRPDRLTAQSTDAFTFVVNEGAR
jgi:hypothetical protein